MSNKGALTQTVSPQLRAQLSRTINTTEGFLKSDYLTIKVRSCVEVSLSVDPNLDKNLFMNLFLFTMLPTMGQ